MSLVRLVLRRRTASSPPPVETEMDVVTPVQLTVVALVFEHPLPALIEAPGCASETVNLPPPLPSTKKALSSPPPVTTSLPDCTLTLPAACAALVRPPTSSPAVTIGRTAVMRQKRDMDMKGFPFGLGGEPPWLSIARDIEAPGCASDTHEPGLRFCAYLHRRVRRRPLRHERHSRPPSLDQRPVRASTAVAGRR
ncbi:MAG: hypothetical protein M3308_05380 [Actinomycetota bacterium]|nr:hypothetical protein [Actinomycetota bacterium]